MYMSYVQALPHSGNHTSVTGRLTVRDLYNHSPSSTPVPPRDRQQAGIYTNYVKQWGEGTVMHTSKAVNEKLYWAFAVDATPPSKRYIPSTLPKRNLHRYIITSCSQQAKAMGVRTGMRYSEAKALVPKMRVIVYNR